MCLKEQVSLLGTGCNIGPRNPIGAKQVMPFLSPAVAGHLIGKNGTMTDSRTLKTVRGSTNSLFQKEHQRKSIGPNPKRFCCIFVKFARTTMRVVEASTNGFVLLVMISPFVAGQAATLSHIVT